MHTLLCAHLQPCSSPRHDEFGFGEPAGGFVAVEDPQRQAATTRPAAVHAHNGRGPVSGLGAALAGCDAAHCLVTVRAGPSDAVDEIAETPRCVDGRLFCVDNIFGRRSQDVQLAQIGDFAADFVDVSDGSGDVCQLSSYLTRPGWVIPQIRGGGLGL